MTIAWGRRIFLGSAFVSSLLGASLARADALLDWADITTAIAIDGPNTIHTMALAQNAVYEAVNAITGRYPRDQVKLGPAQVQGAPGAGAKGAAATPGASVDAAIAAASHDVLAHETTNQAARIDTAYQKELGKLPDDPARAAGIKLGQAAAADILTKHANDLPKVEPYRPATAPGVYVPTPPLLGVAYSQQKPWFMSSQAQFRPGPPPALNSERYAQDYNETKLLGGINSTARTPEQTEMVRFWATNLPDVHEGIVRSVALAPGRDVTRNARLFAAAFAAMNEAEIAIFEAKYYYQFWRPVTATRNGDKDDNPATERDPGWNSLIPAPLQPEYPCGHCILASVLSTVIRLEAGHDPVAVISSTSNTAPGSVHRWTHPQDLVDEVSTARICGGIHFRYSVETGNRMGEQVGELVASAYHMP
jgi:hypothetical protein